MSPLRVPPAQLEAKLAETQARLEQWPRSAVAHEAVGRLLRALGRRGWRDHLQAAAERRAEEAVLPDDHVTAAYLRWVADDPSAASALGAVLDLVGGRVDWDRPDERDAHDWILPAFLLGRDDDVVRMAEAAGATALTPQYQSLARVAAARRAGDLAALHAEVAVWERWAAREPVNSTAMRPAARDILPLVAGLAGTPHG